MREFLSTDVFQLVDGHKPTIIKAPGSVKDYTIDFTQVLDDGLIVFHAQASAQGVSLDDCTVVGSGKMVQVWISGGAIGGKGSVTINATMSDGRTVDERTLFFVIDATG